jgi:hypothetical protein
MWHKRWIYSRGRIRKLKMDDTRPVALLPPASPTMRLVFLASLLAFAAFPARAQADYSHILAQAGITIDLSEDYVLNATCRIPVDFTIEEGQSISCSEIPVDEADQLRHGHYVFVDTLQYRVVTISIHNHFSEQWRSEWLDGPPTER